MSGSSQETNTSVDPFTKERFDEASGNVRGILDANPFQSFDNPLTAGINETQTAAQNQFSAGQGAGINALTQAQGAAQGAAGFQPQSFDGADLSGFLNPFTQNVIDASTGQLRRENSITQNDIASQASQANAFGGSRHAIVEAEQNRNFNDQLADTVTGLNFQNFNNAASLFGQDQDRALQGANLNLNAANQLGILGQSLGNENRANSGALNAFGAQQQQTEQAGLSAQYQEFLRAQEDPFRRAQVELGILGSVPSVTDTETTQNPGSLGVIGTGLQLAGTAATLFSDRRLKTDIKRIGERLGHAWYQFKYVWDNATLHEGVMADEVPSHAVIESLSGYNVVNYGAL